MKILKVLKGNINRPENDHDIRKSQRIKTLTHQTHEIENIKVFRT